MNKGLKLFCLSALALFIMSCAEPKKNNEESVNKEQIIVDNLMTRRSIRAYKDDVVPREIMDVILECGIHAPNGMNKQPWEIRIVNDPEILNGMTDAYLSDMDEDNPRYPKKDPKFRNMFRNAPTVVFIAMEPGMCSQVDC